MSASRTERQSVFGLNGNVASVVSTRQEMRLSSENGPNIVERWVDKEKTTTNDTMSQFPPRQFNRDRNIVFSFKHHHIGHQSENTVSLL